MKRLFAALVFVATLHAQSTLSNVAGVYVAANYGQWSVVLSQGNQLTGTQTIGIQTGQVVTTDGVTFFPFAVGVPIIVGGETVTPLSTGCTSSLSCQLTAVFAAVHNAGTYVSSGTFGLQEAINYAASKNGGIVEVDSAWTTKGGTTGMITSAVPKATVVILDNRGTQQYQYTVQGGVYTQVASGGGTITAVTGTAPITSSGGTTPAIGVTTTTFALLGRANTFGAFANSFLASTWIWPACVAGVSSAVNNSCLDAGTGAHVWNPFTSADVLIGASGSGTVNTGTAGHLGYYATSTTAISDMGADFTFSTHTLAGGASAILDLSSVSAFKPKGGGGSLTLGSANQNWATLGTGIVKNTTTTGAISDAASADVIGLFSGCSGTQYLGADGNCHTVSGTVRYEFMGTTQGGVSAWKLNYNTLTNYTFPTTDGTHLRSKLEVATNTAGSQVWTITPITSTNPSVHIGVEVASADNTNAGSMAVAYACVAAGSSVDNPSQTSLTSVSLTTITSTKSIYESTQSVTCTGTADAPADLYFFWTPTAPSGGALDILKLWLVYQ